ncbi:MAG: (E)-4-hydroxy-3-methylbut-2-enyl-diphosphate synthase [Muribaculaceae bacterium]|nr:(E)-4-hydroxy-3-methylbut-2-enyl-diphosphate synthase [Muribaculaceae bacterium]
MIFNYKRRSTVSVNVGGISMGSEWPVRVQSMTNTATDDVEASAAQCQRIAYAGADYVRLTAQGVKQAHSIGDISQVLRSQGCHIPLIADIHFNPQAALAAAQVCEGVRINPGNFVDPARTFKQLEYTDEEYQAELERIREALLPFIAICREHHTAVRLGVNHGSLSDRIMSRYGNTAAGMVESVMEFLRVFVQENFLDVVISMKASNVVVMVEAVRRLVKAMDSEDMHFPLHLGVTEAGFGEDGRIKSAVGIGTLMAEGLGDTIRVSLSEDPELEIPVARKLVDYIAQREGHEPLEGSYSEGYDPLCPARRETVTVDSRIGGTEPPVVIASYRPDELDSECAVQPDLYYSADGLIDGMHRFLVPLGCWHGERNAYPLLTLGEWNRCPEATVRFLQLPATTPVGRLDFLRGREDTVLVITPVGKNIPGEQQAITHALDSAGIHCPVVMRNNYADSSSEWLQVKAGTDLGAVMLNRRADGIWLEAPNCHNKADVVRYAFGILQAARQRITKTEFISCPGCGRTMFDLQSTVQRVQQATAHLTHLKIGVMGCIVNGPGEMADADYGYVGAAAGRISLYKGRQCVEMNIPEEDAIDRLVALIKENGDWREVNS